MNLPFYKTSETDIDAALAAFERRKASAQGLSFDARDEVNAKVARIVRDVAGRGDAALLEYTQQFDGVKIAPEKIRVSEEEVQEALSSRPPEFMEALEISADRIGRFQESILLSDPPPVEEGGRRTALRYLPVDAAGICVPGGTASLASSVLMNVIPAVAAGVERIVMITPPGKDARVSPDRLAAAAIAGVGEIYRVSGAQAVAALAFGTETIGPVDFIAGPGNIYVATAKKAVYGKVGIDMIAGPSEVVVLADATARADWIAAELLAQAEHTDGSAVLVTDCPQLASDTIKDLETQINTMAHREEIKARLRRYGCVILCPGMRECIEVCNRLAPEHLVVMSEEAGKTAGKIRHAGAIFLGRHTPVAVGDYIAGPSHTLPTGATARFAGGLTANHFLKSSSIIRYTRKALENDADAVRLLAQSEGLPAHAQSVKKRLDA